jgi:hypothetical protein
MIRTYIIEGTANQLNAGNNTQTAQINPPSNLLYWKIHSWDINFWIQDAFYNPKPIQLCVDADCYGALSIFGSSEIMGNIMDNISDPTSMGSGALLRTYIPRRFEFENFIGNGTIKLSFTLRNYLANQIYAKWDSILEVEFFT